MSEVKSLVKDTAIYGVSSIVGRFLNWGLTPLYTYTLLEKDFGEIIYLYSWIGVLLVLLTYGMETGFFRFVNDEKSKSPDTVFATCQTAIITTTTLFIGAVVLFINPLAEVLKVENNIHHVWMVAIIIAIDVLTALPFARLRYLKQPIRFATYKLINIALTIFLNIFFLMICPKIYEAHPQLISSIYNPEWGASYILVSNMVSSLFMLFLLLLPKSSRLKWSFDKDLLKRILRYSYPILILGLAGTLNHSLDKILLPFLISDSEDAMAQVAIYGANAKISIIMLMFTQAFRYAYEPFIFAKTKGEDKKSSYALAMKYFIIVEFLIFLGVMYYLDVIKYFAGPRYFSGLVVVPIIMCAEFCSGVFFNLSLWYKLTDRTQWGMYFSLIGLAVILSINLAFVPRFGYIASAWAALACYAVIMLLSWILGQKYYPIKYDLKNIAKYLILALVLFALGMWVEIDNIILRLSYRSILLLIYIVFTIKQEKIKFKKS